MDARTDEKSATTKARALRVSEGRPFPLGATWTGRGVNFALFSAHATKVELCLFDHGGEHEIERIELPEYTDEVWHGFLPDARPGTIYAYRVHGPYEPEHGHRFNPNKLLLDPYAKAVLGDVKWNPALFGYKMESKRRFDLRRARQRAVHAEVPCDRSRLHLGRRPATAHGVGAHGLLRIARARLHKAASGCAGGIPRHFPRAMRAGSDRASAQGRRDLGRTASDPHFVDDSYLADKGLRNFWGYNTISFFAPEKLYASVPDFAFSEFKEMVSRLHHAGMEVILDVVYNHTAEGNELGPTLSFKGIDNASYYRLLPDKPRYYINDTGTGNTLNLSHQRVLQMVTDSLRYWVQEMHVDGFRFDLATILAREPYGFDESGGFLDILPSGSGALVGQVDCGAVGLRARRLPGRPFSARLGGMERPISRHGALVLEGRRRRAARVRARASPASADLFNQRGRKPWASVNFITAHDGFTLNDLVSYNDKHNEANGENNRDGIQQSFLEPRRGRTDGRSRRSSACATGKSAICSPRCCYRRAHRCCSAGDEFGRTQKATTTPIARTTRSAGSTGRSGKRARRSPGSSAN